jgi:DNA polymerase-3 subunit alpha
MGSAPQTDARPSEDVLPDAADWPESERLAYEKETLGFFITGHPLERHRAELERWADATTGALAALTEAREVTIGGLVSALRLIKTRKGDRMAAFQLEDLDGSVEVLVFPETYKKVAEHLVDDQVVIVKGKAEAQDEGKCRLLASDVLPFEQAKLAEARHVTIRVPVAAWERSKAERLRDILGAHQGDCPVTIELVRSGAFAAAVVPSAYFRIRPDRALRQEIEELFGPESVILSRGNGVRAVNGGS